MEYPLIAMFGWQEILLVLVVLLLLFGAKKLPDLARSLGKSLGEFKKGKAEGDKEDRDAIAKDSEAVAKDGEETPEDKKED